MSFGMAKGRIGAKIGEARKAVHDVEAPGRHVTANVAALRSVSSARAAASPAPGDLGHRAGDRGCANRVTSWPAPQDCAPACRRCARCRRSERRHRQLGVDGEGDAQRSLHAMRASRRLDAATQRSVPFGIPRLANRDQRCHKLRDGCFNRELGDDRLPSGGAEPLSERRVGYQFQQRICKIAFVIDLT